MTKDEQYRAELKRFKELITPYGAAPGTISITIAKVYPADPEENKHTQGHHVGSWQFKVVK